MKMTLKDHLLFYFYSIIFNICKNFGMPAISILVSCNSKQWEILKKYI